MTGSSAAPGSRIPHGSTQTDEEDRCPGLLAHYKLGAVHHTGPSAKGALGLGRNEPKGPTTQEGPSGRYHLSEAAVPDFRCAVSTPRR